MGSKMEKMETEGKKYMMKVDMILGEQKELRTKD